MINIQLEQIEKLNKIINSINTGDFATAEDVAVQMRNQLQEDVDKAESDIDIQLNLENESKYGK
jgi:hypothetical protein